MEEAFGASDAEGAWVWKDAYEAVEVAQVHFLRKFGAAMAAQAAAPADLLAMLARLAARLPSQARRSEESQQLQQFSTPITLAPLPPGLRGSSPATSSWSPPPAPACSRSLRTWRAPRWRSTRPPRPAPALAQLYREAPITRHNAEQIHDHLPPELRPTIVLMNPPFSASPTVTGRYRAATAKHIGAALARLAEGGRLVAITGNGFSPDNPAWRDCFLRWQERAYVVFSAGLAGKAYARHGTTAETRLTVIDKGPADRPEALPSTHGMAESVEALLELVERHVPDRLPLPGAVVRADGVKTPVTTARPAVRVNGSVAPERGLPLRRPSSWPRTSPATPTPWGGHRAARRRGLGRLGDPGTLVGQAGLARADHRAGRQPPGRRDLRNWPTGGGHNATPLTGLCPFSQGAGEGTKWPVGKRRTASIVRARTGLLQGIA